MFTFVNKFFTPVFFWLLFSLLGELLKSIGSKKMHNPIAEK